MIKIALVGNPNVGKSLIFSRITRIGVISSNYAGSTVDLKVGKFTYKNETFELLDAPGVYSLESFSQADDTAIRIIDTSDIIINVVDATNLERNLNLTLGLLGKQKPMIVCLNFWDDTKHKGIAIDAKALEETLQVPVVPVSALCNEGIPDLLRVISDVRALANALERTPTPDNADQWSRIGAIVNKVQKLSHRHHTILEHLGDFTLHPVGGLVSAFFVLISTFLLVRFMGEELVNAVCLPAYVNIYQPFILHLTASGLPAIITDLLLGQSSDPLQSFGILTTGVYIALVLVFPYFFSFYLLFGFLEDFGYLPRLAVVLDTFFHRLGLHGYSSIPVMLGLGCKVPAFLATRVLTNRTEKVLTISLILMSAPCLPQSAMIVSLGMHYGSAVVIGIFALLFITGLCVNMILNRLTNANEPDLFIEIPSYRMPSVALLAKKLWLRILDYIKEVFPLIAAGVLMIHILDALHIITAVSQLLGKPITFLLGLPHDIAPVMILGFLRKDVSIALLAPFNLSATQFIVASIFMVLYIPCIASFFTLVKELGVLSATKVIGVVFVTALAVSTALHGVFVIAHKLHL